MEKKYTQTISHYTALITFDKFDDSAEELAKVANQITQKLKLRIVKKVFHEFKPIGKTLVLILSQSHLALHTYPEYKTLHIDLVSCSEITEKSFKDVLYLVFNDKTDYRIITKSCNFD